MFCTCMIFYLSSVNTSKILRRGCGKHQLMPSASGGFRGLNAFSTCWVDYQESEETRRATHV
jgi:hypothetical protein